MRRVTMATSKKMHLDPQDTGLWKVKQTDDAAKKAAELLQDDLEASSSSYLPRELPYCVCKF